MNTVIYINALERLPDKRMLSGVRSFADEKGWDVLSVPSIHNPAQLSRLKEIWHPAGFILNSSAGTNNLPMSVFGKTPAIFLGHNTKIRDAAKHCVVNDAGITAELAARELIALKLKTYAYVSWTKSMPWSENRRSRFDSVLKLHGMKACVFNASNFNEGDTELLASLAKWLASMDAPVGVFAANDRMASAVANACRLAKLSVPHDVSIVGVDNDEEICEGSRPTLTSIALDFAAAGQAAAQALHRLIAGKANPGSNSYPPLGIVRRESTRRFQRSDKAVADALERIRREACSGLTAKDVLEMFTCSRRSAELRFRAASGTSILGEITRVRIEKAIALLQEGKLSIDRIAGMCGYKSNSAFSNFFRVETGRSPSSWRKLATSDRYDCCHGV